MFAPATKAQARLRLGLIGIAGSGKTYSALRIAKGLGGRIALIDSENGSASKYAGNPVAFDVATLAGDFSPQRYIDAIKGAGKAGYDVLIIDSLSHAWSGTGGALELVDRAQKRNQGGNSFTAWRDITPLHNALIDAILQSPCHVIATMRAKTEYIMEANERGKMVPKKIGTKPIQRDGMEYEFDVVGDLTQDHDLLITKTRCPALDGGVMPCPGEEVAAILKQWLTDGTPYVPPAPPPEAHPPHHAAPPQGPAPEVFPQGSQGLKVAFDGLIEGLRVCRTPAVFAELRDTARGLKRYLTRPEALEVSQAIQSAVARIEEEQAETERVEREIEREKQMLAEAERKQEARAQLRDEVERDRTRAEQGRAPVEGGAQ